MSYMLAEKIIEAGKLHLICGFCSYKWSPIKPNPKECPNCKRVIRIDEKMVEERKRKLAAKLGEIKFIGIDADSFFTPKCSRCENDGRYTFENKIYCAEHMRVVIDKNEKKIDNNSLAGHGNEERGDREDREDVGGDGMEISAPPDG